MNEKELEALAKSNIKPLSSFKKVQASMDVIETGLFPLDMAVGCKGPDGRLGFRAKSIVEVIGQPGVGKSALIEEMIKTTLERFGPYSVAGLYSEAPEVERMEAKGINVDHILARVCIDPDVDPKKNVAEEQLESLLLLSENPNTRLIFIDSVGALMTALSIFEKNSTRARDLDVKPVAAVANVFNNFLLQFTARNKNAVLVMINHYKETIESAYGFSSDLIKTPGGRFKEFLCDVRIWVRGMKDYSDSAHSVEETKSADSINNSYQVFKNKYSHSTNYRTVKASFDLKTASYNNQEKLLDYAAFFGTFLKKKVKNDKGKEVEVKRVKSVLTPGIAKSGAWVYVGNEQEYESFNGSARAVEYLLQHPEIYDKLKYQIYERSEIFFEDEKPDFESILDGE